jgi:hypothetical protein
MPTHVTCVGRVEPACETRHRLLRSLSTTTREVSGLAKSLYPTYDHVNFYRTAPAIRQRPSINRPSQLVV